MNSVLVRHPSLSLSKAENKDSALSFAVGRGSGFPLASYLISPVKDLITFFEGLDVNTWFYPIKIIHHFDNDSHFLKINKTIIINIIQFESPVEFCFG